MTLFNALFQTWFMAILIGTVICLIFQINPLRIHWRFWKPTQEEKFIQRGIDTRPAVVPVEPDPAIVDRAVEGIEKSLDRQAKRKIQKSRRMVIS